MSTASNNVLNCPNCGKSLSELTDLLPAVERCPACERQTRVVVFPAFSRPAVKGATAEAVMMEGEATCFYHAKKRAQVPCDECGRFLCAVCDLEVNGRHLCPQCLETGAKKGKVQSLERGRFRWDQVISTLLVLPLISCGFLLPLTSLAALVLVVWKWKSPPSLVSNTRVLLIVCAALAFIEFVAGSAFWWFMLFGSRRF